LSIVESRMATAMKLQLRLLPLMMCRGAFDV
jgi:hypothetical protein